MVFFFIISQSKVCYRVRSCFTVHFPPVHFGMDTNMSLNLALDFQIAAERYRHHPAILYNGLKITYSELANSVRYWTILLSRMGVTRGDNVCMMMPNVPEFTIAYFAILHLGAVVVPCNTLLTSHELAYLISHSDSRYILAHQNCMLPCVQAAREVESCAGVIVTGSKETGLEVLPQEFHEDEIYWVEDEIRALKGSLPFSTEAVTVVARHENLPSWSQNGEGSDFDHAPWPAGSGEGVFGPSIQSTIPIGSSTQEYMTGVLLGNPAKLDRSVPHTVFSTEPTLVSGASSEFFSDSHRSLNESSSVWESIPSPDGKLRTAWSPAPVPTNPDDPAVILYTSGTTGFPKGAQLTHFNLHSNAQFVREYMTGYQPGKRTLAILPFYHSFGQTVVQNAALFSGATIVMVPRFDPKLVLQTIAEEHVNVIAAVPTMLIHLARMQNRQNLDVSCVNEIISGGASLSIASFEEVKHAFSNAALLEGYGLSETSPLATAITPAMPQRPGSIGREISGVQVRIMRPDHTFANPGEVGEIVIRGHNVMKGYHKNQLATQNAFVHSWFLTGDLGYCDEEGYFYLVDRKKDIIIRAGMNIYPREIEEVLYAHPEVAQAAVVGVPHPIHGEDVIAFVTLKTAAESDTLALCRYCRTRLAAYKCPQRIILMDELPKGPTGKILKRELRARLEKNEEN